MCLKRLRALLRNQEGSTTVEFALWLPIFFAIFGVATDAALLMHKQTQMIDLARSTSRQVSLGLSSEAEAETFALNRLASASGAVQVTSDAGYVTAAIQVPFSDVVIFSWLLSGNNILNASITMVDEAAAANG